MDYAEVIPKLRAEGKTYAEIRELTGAAKSTISYYCGDNQREKTVNRTRGYDTVIRKYLMHVKETTPCADCYNHFPYYVMQFDHLPGFVKLFNLSQFRDYTHDLEVVKREVSKCDVVCANCHAIREHYRRVSRKNVDEVYDDELD